MREELARMTDKLDNIRRLQEMGMLNSFPSIISQQTDDRSFVGASGPATGAVTTISGHGTLASSKAQTISKEETDATAVMDKIQFYTTELHRLLDLVDANKHTKNARKKASNRKKQQKM